eukprot:270827-Chlamydomonas_euryale.AAC.2
MAVRGGCDRGGFAADGRLSAPAAAFARNVKTVCGPRRVKFAVQPLKKPVGPSVLRMFAAAARGPPISLPPVHAHHHRKKTFIQISLGKQHHPTCTGVPYTIQQGHRPVKTTVLMTSTGLVTVVATKPAIMDAVRCVETHSPQPVLNSTKRLNSSYVPHWQAVTRAARATPAMQTVGVRVAGTDLGCGLHRQELVC